MDATIRGSLPSSSGILSPPSPLPRSKTPPSHRVTYKLEKKRSVGCLSSATAPDGSPNIVPESSIVVLRQIIAKWEQSKAMSRRHEPPPLARIAPQPIAGRVFFNPFHCLFFFSSTDEALSTVSVPSPPSFFSRGTVSYLLPGGRNCSDRLTPVPVNMEVR